MYLGIDIGTSAVKSVLVDQDGKVAAQASSALTLQSPKPSWNEQRPDDWWDAVRLACRELSAAPGYRAVAAIGLSGQMHGAVCLDASLLPVRPAILWNDGRADAECAAMLADMPDIGDRAGVLPMPGFTAPKIRWLARAEPDVHARIRHVMLPKDYVRLKLSGDLATDVSDAAGTMWLDQRTRKWSGPLCDVSETPAAWLPPLFEGTEVTGRLSRDAAGELGLRPGIAIAGGGGDGATGAIGIGAVNEGDAFISLGTSGQLFVATQDYRPQPETLVHAFAHCIPDRWFQMAVLLNGASALGWWSAASKTPIEALLSELGPRRPQQVPLFLPYLSGERTPLNDPHIRGGFYGLTGNTDRAAMTQAVLDAIAYTFCDARDALAKAGTTVDSPAAIGGGARSDHLLQTISDALGSPLRRYRAAENGPAYGAARLAMIASGGGNIDDVVTTPATDRQFTPDPAAAESHSYRLGQFRSLYKALKPYADGTDRG